MGKLLRWTGRVALFVPLALIASVVFLLSADPTETADLVFPILTGVVAAAVGTGAVDKRV